MIACERLYYIQSFPRFLEAQGIGGNTVINSRAEAELISSQISSVFAFRIFRWSSKLWSMNQACVVWTTQTLGGIFESENEMNCNLHANKHECSKKKYLEAFENRLKPQDRVHLLLYFKAIWWQQRAPKTSVGKSWICQYPSAQEANLSQRQ